MSPYLPSELRTIVVCFDKFKDALTAEQACALAREVLRRRLPRVRIVSAPLTDGGEGFVRILTGAVGGELRCREVLGPRGEPREAHYGWVKLENLEAEVRRWLGVCGTGSAAVIEMAQASGLESVPVAHRNPWKTSTFGVGQLLEQAARDGAAACFLGIGGSATNDLGTGALAALGLKFVTESGTVLKNPTPECWDKVARIEGIPVCGPQLRIACDVRSPLLGPRGAAAVFGPQKGLLPDDLPQMENSMARMARLLGEFFGIPPGASYAPSSGAAGGLGFGLTGAFPESEYRPGFDWVRRWLGLDRSLAEADLIVTGEGRFDLSSVEGKGPGVIALESARRGIPVKILAGSTVPEVASRLPRGVEVHSITPPGTPLSEALAKAGSNLQRVVEESVAQWMERG